MIIRVVTSVADPDPSDPYIFVQDPDPLSQGYGSGSFYRQAKIDSKKNLDSYCFVTFFMNFIIEK